MQNPLETRAENTSSTVATVLYGKSYTSSTSCKASNETRSEISVVPFDVSMQSNPSNEMKANVASVGSEPHSPQRLTSNTPQSTANHSNYTASASASLTKIFMSGRAGVKATKPDGLLDSTSTAPANLHKRTPTESSDAVESKEMKVAQELGLVSDASKTTLPGGSLSKSVLRSTACNERPDSDDMVPLVSGVVTTQDGNLVRSSSARSCPSTHSGAPRTGEDSNRGTFLSSALGFMSNLRVRRSAQSRTTSGNVLPRSRYNSSVNGVSGQQGAYLETLGGATVASSSPSLKKQRSTKQSSKRHSRISLVTQTEEEMTMMSPLREASSCRNVNGCALTAAHQRHSTSNVGAAVSFMDVDETAHSTLNYPSGFAFVGPSSAAGYPGSSGYGGDGDERLGNGTTASRNFVDDRMTPEQQLKEGPTRCSFHVIVFANVFVMVVVVALVAFLPIYLSSRSAIALTTQNLSITTADGLTLAVLDTLTELPATIHSFATAWQLNRTMQAFPWGGADMERAMRHLCNLLSFRDKAERILYLHISSPFTGFGAFCSGQYNLTLKRPRRNELGREVPSPLTVSMMSSSSGSDIIAKLADFQRCDKITGFQERDYLMFGSYNSNNQSSYRYMIDKSILAFVTPSWPLLLVKRMNEYDFTVDFGGASNAFNKVALPWLEAYRNGASFQAYWSSNTFDTIVGNVTQLSYSYPFLDADGSLAIISGAIQPLGISNVLEDYDLGGGRAMVMDPSSGTLVASSWGTRVSIAVDNWNSSYEGLIPKSVIISVDDLDDPLMRLAVRALGGAKGLEAVPLTLCRWQKMISYDGKDVAITAERVVGVDRGLNMIVVVAIFRSDLLDSINRSRSIVIGCLVAALIIFLILDYFLVYKATVPLRRVVVGLRKAATLRESDEKDMGKISIIAELAEIQVHFKYLSEQLMIMKTFLPLGVMGGGGESVTDMELLEEQLQTMRDEALERDGEENFHVDVDVSGEPTRAAVAGITSPVGESRPSMPSAAREMHINERALLDNINVFRRRYCTMMYIRLLMNQNATTINDSVAEFMEASVPIILKYSGVIEIHRAEMLCISFGAHTKIAMHQTRAARCAVEILAQAPPSIRPRLSVVLDVGEYFVGTCGAANRNARVTWSTQMMVQQEVSKVVHALQCHIVVTQQMATTLESQLVTIPVDALLVALSRKPVVLYELRGYFHGYPSEERESVKELSRKIRSGFAKMLAGNYPGALAVLEPLRERDSQAARLHDMAQRLAENGCKKPFVRAIGKVRMDDPEEEFDVARAPYVPLLHPKHLLPNMPDLLGPGRSRLGLDCSQESNASRSRGTTSLSCRKDDMQSMSHDGMGFMTPVNGTPANASPIATKAHQPFDLSLTIRGVAVSEGEAGAGGETKSVASEGGAGNVSGCDSREATALFEMFVDPSTTDDEGSGNHRHGGDDWGGDGDSLRRRRGSNSDDRASAADDAYALLDDDQSGQHSRPLRGELPVIFKDLQGNVWRRSADVLGTGAFASVYRGMSTAGVLVALKCMTLRSRDVDFQRIAEEVNLFAQLQHENIVQYLSCCVSSDFLTVIMELVPGGSLETIIGSFGRLSKSSARRFLRDILHGLEYLHSKQIVHCDIKPHNVLVGMDGTCKLSDFGSSMHRLTNSVVNIDDVLDMRGTATYMPPEVARGEVPTMKSDVFSLGVTVLHMVMGRLPWEYAANVMGNSAAVDADGLCQCHAGPAPTAAAHDLPQWTGTGGDGAVGDAGRGPRQHPAPSAGEVAGSGGPTAAPAPCAACGKFAAATAPAQSGAVPPLDPATWKGDSGTLHPPPVPPSEQVPVDALMRNQPRFVSAIAKGEVVPFVDSRLDEDVRVFAQACIDPNPAMRPTVTELLTFMWMI